jgi:outer membrane immunogenic protein
MQKLWGVTMAVVAAVSLSPVRAADLPQKAPPGEAQAASFWRGCYLGAEGGGVWGSSQHISANPATSGEPITPKFNESGGIVGGMVGCNYDIHGWVFGVENDISWTNATGSYADQPPFSAVAVSHTDQKWFDSVRGRIGLAWDRPVMSYVTAGAAFAGTSTNICSTALGLCASDSQVRTGWIAGLGVEYVVWPNVSLKFEYLHADFGGDHYFGTPTSLGSTTIVTRDVSLKDDIVRAGLNWRFTALP